MLTLRLIKSSGDMIISDIKTLNEIHKLGKNSCKKALIPGNYDKNFWSILNYFEIFW